MTTTTTPKGCAPVGSTLRFTTRHSQHADRSGHDVRIERWITEPDDDHDAEVLPMAVVTDLADQVTIEAWPDELSARTHEHLFQPVLTITTDPDGSRPRLTGLDWADSFTYTYFEDGRDEEYDGMLAKPASDFLDRRYRAMNVAIRVIAWLPWPRRHWWKRASS